VLAAIGLGKTINNLGRETSKYKDTVHPGKYKREMEKLFERSNFSQNNDLDTNYNNFIKMLEETRKRATISVIRKHHSTPGKPWITKTILKLIQERDNLFKKWKNASSKNKDAARIKYTSCRNKVQKEISTSKINYYSSKFQEVKTDIRATWALVGEISGKQTPKTVDETIQKYFLDRYSTNAIADTFVDYFLDEVDQKTHTSIPPYNKQFSVSLQQTVRFRRRVNKQFVFGGASTNGESHFLTL